MQVKKGAGRIKRMDKGRVYLVGAGPGDTGLLTLKGMEVLKKAEVVIYDSLCGDEILSSVPVSAKMIFAGKRTGRHSMPQEEINNILIEEAKAGRLVVRLKGGDPLLFGRGGEEMEALRDNGIPYEVVPGVTAALSVPAYAGIPVTHRDCASSVHIVTGHKRAGGKDHIDYDALVKANGTLIFLMGVASLPEITKGLLEAEMDPEMPAAIIENGTTAAQRSIFADVKTLAQKAKEQNIKAPATIVIGNVCAYADDLKWREDLPLFGRKIILCRPEGRNEKTARILREKGAEVLEFPSISTRETEENSRLKECISDIGKYGWIAFTGAEGVRIFFKKLFEYGKDARSLSGIKFAAIGSATAEELKKYAIAADLVPEKYDGASLGKELAKRAKPNERILIPRSSIGGDDIINALKARQDITADDVPVYDTFYEKPAFAGIRKCIKEGTADCVVFASASAVRGFTAAFKGEDLTKTVAVCIGEPTQKEADKYGMKSYVADSAEMRSVEEKITDLFGRA